MVVQGRLVQRRIAMKVYVVNDALYCYVSCLWRDYLY